MFILTSRRQSPHSCSIEVRNNVSFSRPLNTYLSIVCFLVWPCVLIFFSSPPCFRINRLQVFFFFCRRALFSTHNNWDRATPVWSLVLLLRSESPFVWIENTAISPPNCHVTLFKVNVNQIYQLQSYPNKRFLPSMQSNDSWISGGRKLNYFLHYLLSTCYANKRE